MKPNLPIFILLLTLSHSALAQGGKRILDYADLLYLCLTEKKEITEDWLDDLEFVGYEGIEGQKALLLEDAEIKMGNLAFEDFDLTNDEDGYDSLSAEHPIIKELVRKYPEVQFEIDTAGRLVIENHLLVRDSHFEFLGFSNLNIRGKLYLGDNTRSEDFHHSYIENCQIENLVIFGNKENEEQLLHLSVSDNIIDSAFFKQRAVSESLEVFWNKINILWLEQMTPEEQMTINENRIQRLIESSSETELFEFSFNQLEMDSSRHYHESDTNTYGVKHDYYNVVNMSDNESKIFSFQNNEINFGSNCLVSIDATADKITIYDNNLSGHLLLNGLTGNSRLQMERNKIDGYISFDEVIFSETFNLFHWFELSGKLASLPPALDSVRYDDAFNYAFNRLASDKQLEDSLAVDKLMRDYYQLYTIFKQNGNLRYANACYSEMKDLESIRLGYNYRQSGKLKDWFRWRLGQLLKFYTDNGTDPAKSLVISFYIILGFAVLYFFYPSDWDVTSKAKLIANLKIALKKQEKNKSKAILRATGLFFLSLVNAITLSLNSFITLGFGTIPTYGLARYICIIQGFIGWFLLSLFTVALINQVLF